MKKILLIFSLFFLSLYVSAQTGVANRKDALIIKNSMLVVVLDEDSTPYNKAIQTAMNNYWKFSGYTFIYSRDKNNYCKPGYTLIDRYTGYGLSHRLSYIAIVFPDEKNCEWYKLDLQAYSYASFDRDHIKAHAIRAVQFIQNYLNLVINEKLGGDGLGSICRMCNSEKKLIKQKMLFINDGETVESVSDVKKICRYYDYDFKLVSLEEIDNAIIEQNEDIVYTINIMEKNGLTYRMVVQGKDSKILYCQHSLTEQYIGFRKEHYAAISK